jgi:hypothetical protein
LEDRVSPLGVARVWFVQGLSSVSPPHRPLVGRPANLPDSRKAGSSCRGLLPVFVIWPLPGLPVRRARNRPAMLLSVCPQPPSAAARALPDHTDRGPAGFAWVMAVSLRPDANSPRLHRVDQGGKVVPTSGTLPGLLPGEPAPGEAGLDESRAGRARQLLNQATGPRRPLRLPGDLTRVPELRSNPHRHAAWPSRGPRNGLPLPSVLLDGPGSSPGPSRGTGLRNGPSAQRRVALRNRRWASILPCVADGVMFLAADGQA